MLQIEARGPQDLFLTVTPQASHFQVPRWKRHGPFGRDVRRHDFDLTTYFGRSNRVVLDKCGDLIGPMHLRVVLPVLFPPTDPRANWFRWCARVGRALCKAVELRIGDYVAARHERLYSDCLEKCAGSRSKRAALDEMLGATPLTVSREHELIVPLDFFNCTRDSRQWFPACRAPSSALAVDIELEELWRLVASKNTIIGTVVTSSCAFDTFLLMTDGGVQAVGQSFGSPPPGFSGFYNTGLGGPLWKQYPAMADVTQIAVSHGNAIFLLKDGTVRTIGLNWNGQLGTGAIDGGSFEHWSEPAPLEGRCASVAAGMGCFAAVMEDGSVRFIGQGPKGMFGMGNYIDETTAWVSPSFLRGDRGAIQVAFSPWSWTLILRADGVVLGSGGVGSSVNAGFQTTSFVPIQGATDIVQISAGRCFWFGVRRNGSVFVGGTNPRGQYWGDAAFAISDAVQVACGEQFTMVLLASGRVVTFGANDWGQLGDGSFTGSTALRTVVETGAVAIAAGWDWGAVTLGTGEIRVFGNYWYGQRGDGKYNKANAFQSQPVYQYNNNAITQNMLDASQVSVATGYVASPASVFPAASTVAVSVELWAEHALLSDCERQMLAVDRDPMLVESVYDVEAVDTNLDTGSKRIQSTILGSELPGAVKHLMLVVYRAKDASEGAFFEYVKNPFKAVKVFLNGSEDLDLGPAKFLGQTRLQYGKACDVDGVVLVSYALRPFDRVQPSGHVAVDQLESFDIQVEWSDDVRLSADTYLVKAFATVWQLIRFRNGTCSIGSA